MDGTTLEKSERDNRVKAILCHEAFIMQSCKGGAVEDPKGIETNLTSFCMITLIYSY